ncbi:M14 metallopeptidase family protein [Hyphomonas sp.]|uniref:M14 metallopeptidase family protein n=1 Tax=Hyphomonas sp. TaxID=87 RepID=UPI00391A999A
MAGNFDPAIPSLEETVGHRLGEKITRSEDILTYLQALERAAPDRVRLVTYAQSWQGRPLFYAIIASPETMARLDAVKGDLARLGSGQALSGSEQAEIIRRTPAAVWLGFGVHGDEITPSDSGLALAYHLLASQGDALVERIMANTVVIIDPNQNPDGRARFIHGFTEALGIVPQADRFAAEHDQPWPGGRFNGYVFDMNRDWFAMTQPETRGRVAAYLDWHPVVFVDSHEMGGDETYFFPPAAEPFNPLITDAQKASHDRFGRNRGAWFDRLGIAYFTREIFDAFYPGYGDMWPALNGAIAKTFEQGSPRGLVFARRNGDLLTFEEGVFNNFIASLATLETAANEKDRLLTEYAAYRRSAVTEGERAAERYYVIDLAQRRGQAERLGRTLAAQGIAVSRANAGVTFCGRNYPAGALVIDKAQGAGRLARALLEPQIALPADFMVRQEERRKAGLPHELYDVTAWSMPLMEGVSVAGCRNLSAAGLTRVAPDSPPPAVLSGQGDVAYAVPWTDAVQARIVVAALQAGLTGSATDEAFTQGGREFGKGTVVFPRAGNPDDLGAQLRAIAAGHGGEIASLPTSWVERGPNFGSSAFVRLTAPRIAMAWDDGTSPTEAGAARWTLEHKLGLPVTPIRVRTLRSAQLSDYDVLVLPEVSGRFSAALGSAGAGALKEFTARGGVLVSFGSATGVLASEEVGLLSTVTEKAWTEAEAVSDEARRKGTRLGSLDEYEAMIADPEAAPETVPGTLVRVEADPDHWLAAGYDRAIALVSGRTIFRPLGRADGANVLRFADAGELVASGYLWEESRLQLAYKPFLMAENRGQGLVIAFTQSPVTRGYLGGLDLLVANAVLTAPARVKAGSAR